MCECEEVPGSDEELLGIGKRICMAGGKIQGKEKEREGVGAERGKGKWEGGREKAC